MKHLCIFCNGRVNSKEHVWPTWLLKEIAQLPGANRTLHNVITTPNGVRNRWSKRTPEIVTKNVCKVACNEGWMSDLEMKVAPILLPMIKGEHQILPGKQQEIIARWIMKTAMVLDSMPPMPSFMKNPNGFIFVVLSCLPGI